MSSKSVFRRLVHRLSDEEGETWLLTGVEPSRCQEKWEVSMHGESCRLRDLLGLEYIHKALSTDRWAEFVWASAGKNGRAVQCHVRPVALAFGPESQPERLRPDSLTPSRLKNFISDMERRAKEALEAGDKAEYDRLTAGVKGEAMGLTGVRKYQRDVTGSFGSSRRFSDQGTRERDAVSHAIAAAIQGIRKCCPGIAQHLKDHILPDGRGCWFYNGDTENWDTQAWEETQPNEQQRGCDPSSADTALALADSIRKRWVTEMQTAFNENRDVARVTRDGNKHARSRTPITHRKCGKRMPDKGEVVECGLSVEFGDEVCTCSREFKMRDARRAANLWREIGSGEAGNRFEIKSLALLSRTQIEALNEGIRDTERECEEYDYAETKQGKELEGDDREAVDFE